MLELSILGKKSLKGDMINIDKVMKIVDNTYMLLLLIESHITRRKGLSLS